MAKDKEDKPASTRAQAVTNFTVPVTAAWLLAVAGIVGWDVSVEKVLENSGKIAAALGVGVAFLTVVLSAVQDIVPLWLKQRLLFHRGEPGFSQPRATDPWPSYWAFSKRIIDKADPDIHSMIFRLTSLRIMDIKLDLTNCWAIVDPPPFFLYLTYLYNAPIDALMLFPLCL